MLLCARFRAVNFMYLADPADSVTRIYKDKYMDAADSGSGRGRMAKKDGEKKPREKSRTRLFSRKKSTV